MSDSHLIRYLGAQIDHLNRRILQTMVSGIRLGNILRTLYTPYIALVKGVLTLAHVVLETPDTVDP